MENTYDIGLGCNHTTNKHTHIPEHTHKINFYKRQKRKKFSGVYVSRTQCESERECDCK